MMCPRMDYGRVEECGCKVVEKVGVSAETVPLYLEIAYEVNRKVLVLLPISDINP
jgi:hypothetical protein